MTLTFLGHVMSWGTWTKPYRPFINIGGPLEPNLYLERLTRIHGEYEYGMTFIY